MTKPKIIHGEVFTDDRGSIKFNNTFDMSEIKRFYEISPKRFHVRAWQGHQVEKKWFMPIIGAFEIVLVHIDNWDKPSDMLRCYKYIIHADRCEILFIPGGVANGFRALSEESKAIVFSNFDLKESLNDDFRFDKNRWYNW